MEDHVLFPDTSSTWTAALFAVCFELIALSRAAAAVAGGRGETEDRMDSQPEIQQQEKREAITAVIIYVSRRQLHRKHSSGKK